MRDLTMLLLAFPDLKSETSAVLQCLRSINADEPVFAAWRELVAQEIKVPDDDSEFD